jgi:hypothetical protein
MGAIVREVGTLTYKTCATALDDYGYVLHLEKTTDKVEKTKASNLKVYGVANQNTKDPLDGDSGTAKTNISIAICREGEVQVQLLATNATIQVGDLLIAQTNGTVDKYIPTSFSTFNGTNVDNRFKELGRIAGVASEAKAANAGGKIITKLQIMETVSAND